ncbi:hypothetical protein [Archaeoglobus sp.]
MEAEYAYVDGVRIKGNSNVAVSYLEAIKELVEKLEIKELVFQTDGYSGALLSKPVMIFVKVRGDTSLAKVQARRILRELGDVKKDDLEEVFELAEKIESMSIEDVVRMLKK